MCITLRNTWRFSLPSFWQVYYVFLYFLEVFLFFFSESQSVLRVLQNSEGIEESHLCFISRIFRKNREMNIDILSTKHSEFHSELFSKFVPWQIHIMSFEEISMEVNNCGGGFYHWNPLISLNVFNSPAVFSVPFIGEYVMDLMPMHSSTNAVFSVFRFCCCCCRL